jgi:hypothetical protein
MLADAAHVADGKLYVHGGGITRFTIPELPAGTRISVVTRLIIEPGDAGIRSVQLQWLAPSGDVILQADGEVSASRPPTGVLEGEEPAAVIVLEIPILAIQEYGVHELVFRLDGEAIGRRPIVVATPAEADAARESAQ